MTITKALSREKFLDTILRSMCACSHKFSNLAVTEPMSLEVCGLSCQDPSSASFVQCGHIRQIAWQKDFWRSFRNQMISTRTGTRATIITTNLLFTRWEEVIKDKVLCSALIDRLCHKAHMVNMTGQSYRVRETQKMLKNLD